MNFDHIAARKSFALETTLRSPVTFDQSRLAHKHGFWTSMDYLTAGSVEESIRRIMERSYRGGHSASEQLSAISTKRVPRICSPPSTSVKAGSKWCGSMTTQRSAGG